MAEALDWERKAIGATVSVFLVISAISLFIASSLADRFPLCLILSSGLTLSTARIGALGFVTAPWQVIALYGMVFGISAGLASPPPVGVMLTRRFPTERASPTLQSLQAWALQERADTAVARPEVLPTFGSFGPPYGRHIFGF